MQLSNAQEPAVLGTLAAAYAEAGWLSAAVKTAEQALVLATSQNDTALAEVLRAGSSSTKPVLPTTKLGNCRSLSPCLLSGCQLTWLPVLRAVSAQGLAFSFSHAVCQRINIRVHHLHGPRSSS